nr:hypothetical protein [Amycolatopsis sp. FDAARGOS 1241]
MSHTLSPNQVNMFRDRHGGQQGGEQEAPTGEQLPHRRTPRGGGLLLHLVEAHDGHHDQDEQRQRGTDQEHRAPAESRQDPDADQRRDRPADRDAGHGDVDDEAGAPGPGVGAGQCERGGHGRPDTQPGNDPGQAQHQGRAGEAREQEAQTEQGDRDQQGRVAADAVADDAGGERADEHARVDEAAEHTGHARREREPGVLQQGRDDRPVDDEAVALHDRDDRADGDRRRARELRAPARAGRGVGNRRGVC